MTRREIELLNNKVVTMDQMEEIKAHEEVMAVTSCGILGMTSEGQLYEIGFNDNTTSYVKIA